MEFMAQGLALVDLVVRPQADSQSGSSPAKLLVSTASFSDVTDPSELIQYSAFDWGAECSILAGKARVVFSSSSMMYTCRLLTGFQTRFCASRSAEA